jgi:hypothetical protein
MGGKSSRNACRERGAKWVGGHVCVSVCMCACVSEHACVSRALSLSLSTAYDTAHGRPWWSRCFRLARARQPHPFTGTPACPSLAVVDVQAADRARRSPFGSRLLLCWLERKKLGARRGSAPSIVSPRRVVAASRATQNATYVPVRQSLHGMRDGHSYSPQQNSGTCAAATARRYCSPLLNEATISSLTDRKACKLGRTGATWQALLAHGA